jgi:N-acetylmuramoyl-L-alanine amidase
MFLILSNPAKSLDQSFFNSSKLISKITVIPGHDNRKDSEYATGRAGKENSLNLKISSQLEKKLEERGFDVWMTRDNRGYDKNMINLTRMDIESNLGIYQRDISYKRILRGIAKYMNTTENTDAAIQIHMNKGTREMKGFCVYYRNAESKELAEFIRDELKNHFKISNNVDELEGIALKADNYLLNNISKPSVLIECGYMGEAKYKSPKIQELVAEDIEKGLFKFAMKSYGLGFNKL